MAPYDHDQPEGGGERHGPRCPICRQPTADAHKPFCSKRCADVDLHRWLAGVYHVPTNEKPEDESEKEK
jgi:endogenous inhibitor of DNA gyrase (YacG/DUF329 family)